MLHLSLQRTINDDSVNKVDSLACSVQVNLGPIVFARGGVRVARRGGGGDTSIPEICNCICRIVFLQ